MKTVLVKSSKAALQRIREINESFYSKYKRYPKCSLNYSMRGKKPNFIHEIVIRHSDTEEKEDFDLMCSLLGE